MKKLVTLLLAFLIVFSLCAAASADDSTETDSSMTVTDSSLFTKELKDNKYSVWVIGSVKNEGNAAVRIKNIYIDLTDADGNVFTEVKGSSVWPSDLGPGETAYFNISKQISDVTDPSLIAEYTVRVETDSKAQDIVYLDTEADAEYVKNSETVTSVKFSISVKNQNAEDEFSPIVCYQAYDQNGDLLYVFMESFAHLGIPSGQSVIFTESTDTTLEAIWAELDRVPTSVSAVTYCK